MDTLVKIVMTVALIMVGLFFLTDISAKSNDNLDLVTSTISMNDISIPYTVQSKMPGACPCDDSDVDKYYLIKPELYTGGSRWNNDGVLIGMIKGKEEGVKVLPHGDSEWRMSEGDLEIIEDLFKESSIDVKLNDDGREDLFSKGIEFTDEAKLSNLCEDKNDCDFEAFKDFMFEAKKGVLKEVCATSTYSCELQYRKAISE